VEKEIEDAALRTQIRYCRALLYRIGETAISQPLRTQMHSIMRGLTLEYHLLAPKVPKEKYRLNWPVAE
jgi:hypothetical protein